MTYLRTDQRTHLNPDCPIGVDLHPADHVVDVVIGDWRFGEDCLSIVLSDPAFCRKLSEAVNTAGRVLADHLLAMQRQDPAMSQLEGRTLTRPVTAR